MAVEEMQADAVVATAGGGKMKFIVLGVAGLLLLVTGIFAGPAVMNLLSAPETEIADGEAPGDDSKSPPIYQTLHPPLVVNLMDRAGDAHFMQITMEVMARDQSVVNSVRDNIAVIRNALILLYGSAVYEEVTTRDGKEQMLEDGLAEIEKVMLETTGAGGVEALYFTALVIQ